MKKSLLILFLLPMYLTAQEEFSFQLYFEDAVGNRDTVTVGYDDNATHAIETAFGEEDIKSLPWDNQCEVRITDFSKTFHTKKQIIKNHCGEFWNILEPIFIDIKNPQFPLTISCRLNPLPLSITAMLRTLSCKLIFISSREASLYLIALLIASLHNRYMFRR